ncbi:MAG: DUF6519 domain-containing protein [Acidobacteriota bacterium]|nr:DUF6519 domain-containing protein [Acidobacteriota bacterium]
MKTQISRDNFRPAQRYSGVYQQQGRMFTDYDFNELVTLIKNRLAESLTDVIKSGAPRDRGAAVTQAGAGDPILLKSGWLYADGVPALLVPKDVAQPFTLDNQADFPGAPLPAPGMHFYADVWDRTVTSLEDSKLLDPGLHGADTCSRTRTMAQIKLCPASLNPENTDDIPQIGNALLDLKLPQGVTVRDPCDPCADNLDLDSRVGNYLFRLEVHDVEGNARNPDAVVLKWSRENGAETHATGQEPDAFKSGAWIYEFYDTESETHLGCHLAPGFTPTRGKLFAGYPDPADVPALGKVRRWDGTCTLRRNGSNWTLAADDGVLTLSRDRDKILTTAGSAEAWGKVTLGATFGVNLETVVLDLTLATRTFLAGDYWQVAVREAVHKAGDTLATDLPPMGIRHHYLRLGTTNAAGDLIPHRDARRRILNFPPLTDMHAIDIAIDNNCPKLYDGAVNLQEALDNLCAIEASDIAFTDNCPKLFDGADNLQTALDNLCAIEAGDIAFTDNCPKLYSGAEDLQTALDNLCAIDAGDIGFTPDEDCELLKDAETVKEALDTLCKRPVSGGGCRVTIGEGGDFPDLESFLRDQVNDKATDICVCLLPGEHVVTDLRLNRQADKLHISLEGCGPGVVVRIEKLIYFNNIDALHLEGIRFLFEPNARILLYLTGDVRIEACQFDGGGILPQIMIWQSAPAHITQCRFQPDPRSTLNVAANITAETNMIAFFNDRSEVPLETLANQTAEALVAQSFEQRSQIVDNIATNLKRFKITNRENSAYTGLMRVIGRDVASQEAVAAGLIDVVNATFASRPASSLILMGLGQDMSMVDNRITGTVALESINSNLASLNRDELSSFNNNNREGKVTFTAANGRLSLRGNRITQMVMGNTLINQVRAVLNGGAISANIFKSVHLTDNVFELDSNSILARNHHFSNNTVPFIENFNTDLFHVVGETALYMGNHCDEISDIAMIINATRSPKTRSRDEMNNVLILDA